MNILPIFRCAGTVHRATLRTVPALEASEAQRDPETQRITRDARVAREAYDVLDVVLLTPGGGFVSVGVKDESVEQGLGGVVPDAGEVVDWPVRAFVQWGGSAGRRYPMVAFAVAGEVLAAEKVATAEGKRSASLSSAS